MTDRREVYIRDVIAFPEELDDTQAIETMIAEGGPDNDPIVAEVVSVAGLIDHHECGGEG